MILERFLTIFQDFCQKKFKYLFMYEAWVWFNTIYYHYCLSNDILFDWQLGFEVSLSKTRLETILIRFWTIFEDFVSLVFIISLYLSIYDVWVCQDDLSIQFWYE